jgi:hypothetical protein
MMKLPMIVTTSQGGPYPDEPFQAGYSMAMIQIKLADPDLTTQTFVVPAYSASVPQLDLIAMAYGWTTKVLHTQDEWSCVLLTRDSMISCENTEG